MIIDVHSHVLLDVDDGWMAKSGMLRPLGDGNALLQIRGIPMIAAEDLLSPEKQAHEAELAGLSLRIISSVEAIHLLSTCAGRQTLDVARRTNDAMAKLVHENHGRLIAMASVNPFEGSHVSELERAVDQLGLKGVCIPTSWDRLYLDSNLALPFFECAQALELAVFVHPPLLPIGYDAMEEYRLAEVVGRVFDTTLSIARMIYAGIFDRFPKLKVIVPHMGAGLMGVMGRLDMGYRLGYQGHAAYQAAACERKPSEYLDNLYVDTMGFWPSMMKQLLEVFGADRILFGSDYPAVAISPTEHITLIESLQLSDFEKNAIFH
ncbi:MAG: amidohydrolase family protein, partial [Planctomycetales bacterium]|nr:amidohydrolase family protein [Planctomycetales bacterium]